MSNNDEKISLDNFNYESKSCRLTSPHSIKACRVNGVTEQDLYKITLDEYIQNYPESKQLPKEYQQERYDNYEENRTKLIDLLKETRGKLKEESEKKKEEGKEKNKEDSDDNEPRKDKYGFPIKNKENRKKYKKLKEDMELTIRVQIDNEYEKIEKRKKNDAKTKKEEDYEDRVKKENEQKQKEKNNDLNQKKMKEKKDIGL